MPPDIDVAQRRTRRRWIVVATAGALIAAGFALREISGPAHAGLFVAATVIAGAGIAARAVQDVRIRRIGIEALVTIAAVGALVIGELWEAAAVTWLFAFGGALEAMTIGRTRRALSHLLDLVPETATVRRDGAQVRVSPSEVRLDEVVIVRPGDRIPVDGEVVAGAPLSTSRPSRASPYRSRRIPDTRCSPARSPRAACSRSWRSASARRPH